MSMPAPASAIDFDHVGVSVADLDAAVRFYGDGLGLREEFRFEIPEHDLRAVVLRSAQGYGIEVLERAGAAGGIRASDQDAAVLTHGYGHFCLRVSDLDAVHDHLLGLGASTVRAPGVGPHPAVRFAYMADPEGNLFEMVEYGPGFTS